MNKLHKFKTTTEFILSATTSQISIDEIFLASGLSKEFNKKVLIKDYGEAYVTTDFNQLQESHILQMIKNPTTSVTSIRVYSLPDIAISTFNKDELVLEHHIKNPTVEKLSLTLGIKLI